MLSLLRGDRTLDNLSSRDYRFLNDLAVAYELKKGDYGGLLRRVDIIPVSQVLAQGAEESGWGTSRFARKGNAVFGQRTFSKGAGLVPLKRRPDQKFEVKAFSDLYTSVRSYVFNLNTHFAYEEFRRMRADFRARKQPLNSYVLIGSLDSYSERGQKYIDTIGSIIRVNRLRDFDNARLLSENRNHIPS